MYRGIHKRINIQSGWFGFFVQWHINFYGLFNAKAILFEEQQQYYSMHSEKDKRINILTEGICLKTNVKERQEFELSYFKATVLHFNHHAMENLSIQGGVEVIE